MKKLKNCLAQGFAIKTLQGWVKTISVLALGAALFMVPMASKADPVPPGGPILMTQYDLIKCLASLVGDQSSLVDTEAKAVYYAKKRLGLKPKAGFHPNVILTRLFLAEIIQDLFRLKGKDAVMALEREGIVLTGDQQVQQQDIVPTFDGNEFQTRLASLTGSDCSPSKKTKKSKLNKIRKSKCKVKKAPKPQKPQKPKKPK